MLSGLLLLPLDFVKESHQVYMYSTLLFSVLTHQPIGGCGLVNTSLWRFIMLIFEDMFTCDIIVLSNEKLSRMFVWWTSPLITT